MLGIIRISYPTIYALQPPSLAAALVFGRAKMDGLHGSAVEGSCHG